MKKVTIADINESLYDANLDTEYREALASSMLILDYVSDSPLNLYLGSNKQRKELEKVETKALKADQISELIHLMMYKMRDDFQYVKFKPVAMKYLEIVNKMREKSGINQIEEMKTVKPQCKLDTPIMFEMIGEVSKILKENNLHKESAQMIERATSSYDYDDALNVIKEYVEIIEKENTQYEEEEFE